jgi:hypothetical protein
MANGKPVEVTQEMRDDNQKRLIEALQEYYKILALDFDKTHEEEDEDFLDGEMKRVETFLLGLSEDALNELRFWNNEQSETYDQRMMARLRNDFAGDAERMDYLAEATEADAENADPNESD